MENTCIELEKFENEKGEYTDRAYKLFEFVLSDSGDQIQQLRVEEYPVKKILKIINELEFDKEEYRFISNSKSLEHIRNIFLEWNEIEMEKDDLQIKIDEFEEMQEELMRGRSVAD